MRKSLPNLVLFQALRYKSACAWQWHVPACIILLQYIWCRLYKYALSEKVWCNSCILKM